MSASPERSPPTAADVDRGAQRLLDALTADCDPSAALGLRIETALGAALRLLAIDPELAELICGNVFLGEDEEVLRSRRSCRRRCAQLLRETARESSGAGRPPPFAEPLLVDGLQWFVASRVRVGRAKQLPALGPELSAVLLVYYDSPGGARPSLRSLDG